MSSSGALVLLADGGAAGAAIASPIDSSGVIYDCYSNTTTSGRPAILLHDAGTNYSSSTTAIKRSQQGPAGSAGAHCDRRDPLGRKATLAARDQPGRREPLTRGDRLAFDGTHMWVANPGDDISMRLRASG
jgi:hypothetical protein